MPVTAFPPQLKMRGHSSLSFCFPASHFFHLHALVCVQLSGVTALRPLWKLSLCRLGSPENKVDLEYVWSGRAWDAAGIYLFSINLFVIFLHDLGNIYFPEAIGSETSEVFLGSAGVMGCWTKEIFLICSFCCGGRHFVTFCGCAVVMNFLKTQKPWVSLLK